MEHDLHTIYFNYDPSRLLGVLHATAEGYTELNMV